eukprot:scaffold3586_cov404-Prasinococcus_capsulatus_cf.AAC.18
MGTRRGVVEEHIPYNPLKQVFNWSIDFVLTLMRPSPAHRDSAGAPLALHAGRGRTRLRAAGQQQQQQQQHRQHR